MKTFSHTTVPMKQIQSFFSLSHKYTAINSVLISGISATQATVTVFWGEICGQSF